MSTLNTTEPARLVHQAMQRVKERLEREGQLPLGRLMDEVTDAEFPEDAVPLAVMELRARQVFPTPKPSEEPHAFRHFELAWPRAGSVTMPEPGQRPTDEGASHSRMYFEEREPRRDARDEFRLDRYRIIYSPFFERLAGVTQVTPPEWGLVLHTRMTHSLKVAYVARQIAERLLSPSLSRTEAPESLTAYVNADVVEASALAHDIGHPPFGHVAEHQLNELMGGDNDRLAGQFEGFEGNAQTFRILTHLATGPYAAGFRGMNLTRATLDGVLKYPWLRRPVESQTNKCGAYLCDREPFEWVKGETKKRSLAAELMDWADDVTYAVHDLEDFYRAGLIPFDLLAGSRAEGKRFMASFDEKRRNQLVKDGVPEGCIDDGADELCNWIAVGLRYPYDGAHLARAKLREMTSYYLSRFLGSVSLVSEPSGHEPTVKIDAHDRALVALLKYVTWHYVIESPALGAIQRGQTLIVETLWKYYFEAAVTEEYGRLPWPVRLEAERAVAQLKKPSQNHRTGRWEGPAACALARIACDFVASMTEARAIALYARLQGMSAGSVLDMVAH